MHIKHNSTMVSAASPSANDPKMVDLCNHTAQASSSDGYAEDGTSNVSLSQILMEMSGRSVVGNLLVFGLADL